MYVHKRSLSEYQLELVNILKIAIFEPVLNVGTWLSLQRKNGQSISTRVLIVFVARKDLSFRNRVTLIFPCCATLTFTVGDSYDVHGNATHSVCPAENIYGTIDKRPGISPFTQYDH